MIKLIIFDYDGVIVDSFLNIFSVYQIICKRLNKKCPERIEDFKKIYGQTSTEGYDNLKFNKEERIKGNIIFKEEILKKEPSIFHGMNKVIETLHKKYKLVLISSSYQEEVEQKLKKFNIKKYFDLVIGNKSHSKRFEKTESIVKILKEFNIGPKETILIGDRNIDFIEGTKAGLSNIILVNYGWGYDLEKIPDYNPKIIINMPEDILNALDVFNIK